MAKPRKGHEEEPAREAAIDAGETARSTRIQDEPESTVGRKPMEPEHRGRAERSASRSSAGPRRGRRGEFG
jgi:hypothetical protein